MNFSVLLSVYRKENPEYLKQSIDSIFTQTVPPTEIVMVEDGPLTDGCACRVQAIQHFF